MAQEYRLNENNTYKITFNLVDENDDAIALSALGTFSCTLYYYNSDLTTSDPNHLATINNRLDQNIKNANNVTVTAAGAVTWYVQPDDNVKLNSGDEELHIALITWNWSGKQNSDEFYFYVRKVPYAI